MIDEMVVVGAGPYGLSAAAHLRSRGLPTRVFGDPMSAWRDHMPSGMMLKSLPSASSISSPKAGSLLDDFCADVGCAAFDSDLDVVPLDLFVEYGCWFASRNVPDVEVQAVRNVARVRDGFVVSLADGAELRTRAVVVASGHVAHRYIPRVLAPLAPGVASCGVVSHSCTPAMVSQLAGKRVAIIGAGQSALENAAVLHEAGADVVVFVRRPSVRWLPRPEPAARSSVHRLLRPPSPIGPGWSQRLLTETPDVVRRLPASARLKLVEHVRGPSGAWWLRHRVEGRVDIRCSAAVTRADAGSDGRVLLEYVNGDAELHYLTVDHVIAATGYRVDLDKVEFLDPSLRPGIVRVAGSRAPALDASFQSSVPGLYFTGLAAAATFGPIMRFVCGTEFAGPRIAAPHRAPGAAAARRAAPTGYR